MKKTARVAAAMEPRTTMASRATPAKVSSRSIDQSSRGPRTSRISPIVTVRPWVRFSLCHEARMDAPAKSKSDSLELSSRPARSLPRRSGQMASGPSGSRPASIRPSRESHAPHAVIRPGRSRPGSSGSARNLACPSCLPTHLRGKVSSPSNQPAGGRRRRSVVDVDSGACCASPAKTFSGRADARHPSRGWGWGQLQGRWSYPARGLSGSGPMPVLGSPKARASALPQVRQQRLSAARPWFG